MDINTIRFAWGTIACWSIILFLSGAFAAGLKTGRVHCGDPTRVYARAKNPRKYWMLILMFVLFVILSFSVWKTMVIGTADLWVVPR